MKRVILQNTVLRMGMTLCLIITLNGCFWPFTMTNGQLVRRQESDFSKNPAEATVAPPKETQAMEPERIEEESSSLLEEIDEAVPVPPSLEIVPEAVEPPASEVVEPPASETVEPPTPEAVEPPAPEKPLIVENEEKTGKRMEEPLRLSEKYPGLATGILSEAVLQELGPGELLSSEDINITEDQFKKEFSRLSEEEREADAPLTFDVFERMATKILLARRVQEEAGITPQDPAWEGAMQGYYDKVAGPAKVSEEDAAAFYLENKELFAETPFDEVKEELRSYLGEEKQQAALEKHLRNFGKKIPIQVHGPWVEQQAGKFKNNVIDKARANGKPLLVDFYAQWCGPCMQMKPTLHKLQDKYADVLTVLFVDVDKHTVLARRHKADSIPLLLLYDARGSLVSRLEGYREEEELSEELQKIGVQ